METILLVRHAEADGHDGEDPPLGPRGVRQAGLLGERLAGTEATRLLHGPRRRARQTAELLAPPAAWMQLTFANASLTALRRRHMGEWSVLGVSDVGHLVGI